METAENTLMDMINVRDYEVSNFFRDDNIPPKSPHEAAKKRSDKMETESFYLSVRGRAITFITLYVQVQSKSALESYLLLLSGCRILIFMNIFKNVPEYKSEVQRPFV